ncbi:GNAT family N-acetyltransferase [Candidatus Woesearchaeota archaeon]|nr:GNAT family N-acetyltransferase [Candidatus Woesearchaeota archaeon]
MELRIIRLTLESFIEYEKDILKSEEIYPPSLRTSKEDFLDILSTSGHITLVALLGDEYVGNIVGSPLTVQEQKEYGLYVKIGQKMMYIYNLLVDSHYQGKGYAKLLIKEFIAIASEHGFDYVMGHFRMGASASLIQKFGGEIKAVISNWEGSGEDFAMCELKLKK